MQAASKKEHAASCRGAPCGVPNQTPFHPLNSQIILEKIGGANRPKRLSARWKPESNRRGALVASFDLNPLILLYVGFTATKFPYLVAVYIINRSFAIE